MFLRLKKPAKTRVLLVFGAQGWVTVTETSFRCSCSDIDMPTINSKYEVGG